MKNSTGPAAVSGGRSSPPLLVGGGGGWTPLCIGKQEAGTYIYNSPYTVHGADWADFFEVLQLLIWWESQ